MNSLFKYSLLCLTLVCSFAVFSDDPSAKSKQPLSPEEFEKNISKIKDKQDKEFTKWLDKRISELVPQASKTENKNESPTPSVKKRNYNAPGSLPSYPFAPESNPAATVSPSAPTPSVESSPNPSAAPPAAPTALPAPPSATESQIYTGFPTGTTVRQPSNQNKSSGWHFKY